MKRALLFLSCFLSAAFAQAPTTFKEFKATYEQQYKRIQNQRQIYRLSTGEKYAKTLAQLEKGFQVAGQFEPMTTAKTERERWLKTARISSKEVVTSPKEVRQVQEGFLKTLKALDEDTARNMFNLGSQYKTKLLALQTKLTKAGRITEAADVNAELKKLIADPVMAKSKRILDAAANEEQAVASAAAAAKPVSTARTFRGSDANRIETRHKAFFEALRKTNPKTAAALIDPNYVRKVGLNGINPRLSVLQGIVKAASGLGVMLVDAKVEIHADKTSATVTPIFENPFTGREPGEDKSTWRLVDGDWYIDFDEAPARAPNQNGQAQKLLDALKNRPR